MTTLLKIEKTKLAFSAIGSILFNALGKKREVFSESKRGRRVVFVQEQPVEENKDLGKLG